MNMKTGVSAHDFFCGVGGSSLALDAAGIDITVAVNHNRISIASHQANFPTVAHDCMDITTIDPARYNRAEIGIFTPECRFHSGARGEKITGQGQLMLWDDIPGDEAAERSRVTMNEVVRFAEYHRYWIVIVENVVDIFHWRGLAQWRRDMEKLGYADQPVFFNSQFAAPDPLPVPQSRDRVYWVFWRTGKRPDLDVRPTAWCEACDQDVAAVQSWKNPNRRWGKYGARRSYLYRCPRCGNTVRPSFYPARMAINWSLPAPRIGDRGKPLKDSTMRRIRVGLERFGGEAFVLDTAYTHGHDRRVQGLSEPAGTVTGQGTRAICVPRGVPTPFRVELHGTSTAGSIQDPCGAVLAGAHHQGFLTSYYRTGTATSLDEATPTVTGRDRHGLVVITTAAHPVRVDDCGFRMLDPDTELKKIMGFPNGYVVTGNKREQVRQLGQSLTPAVVTEIVKRCVATLA